MHLIKFSGATSNQSTYLPRISRKGRFFISGDLSCTSAAETISVALYKNGNTRLQDIDIRCATQNVPYPFSIISENTMTESDYFEVWLTDLTSAGKVVALRTLMFSIYT